MKKGFVLGLLALASVAIAGSAFAGLPCAAYSSCELTVAQHSNCHAGATNPTTDVLFSYGQVNFDSLCIAVTVRDCLGAAIETCSVRFDYSGAFDPQNENGGGTNGWLCGTGSATALTDANGTARFYVVGGGAGQLELTWSVTAECADPEVELCAQVDTLCVKSTDFNGSGNINFFDTFKYLPQLSSGSGWSGNMNCASPAVNFFDTFRYLPDLSAGSACAGFSVGNTFAGADCSAPILP